MGNGRRDWAAIADVRNILEFEDQFPEASVVRLKQNYRSTSVILEAANAVIANNRGRLGKTLFTDSAEGTPIVVLSARTDIEEANSVARSILSAARSGKQPRDHAVLYRTNAQSRLLEDAMRRWRIPYRIVGGLRFFDRREIRDVMAYLRLVANPRDTLAFERAVAWPKRGIGETSVTRLSAWAGEQASRASRPYCAPLRSPEAALVRAAHWRRSPSSSWTTLRCRCASRRRWCYAG